MTGTHLPFTCPRTSCALAPQLLSAFFIAQNELSCDPTLPIHSSGLTLWKGLLGVFLEPGVFTSSVFAFLADTGVLGSALRFLSSSSLESSSELLDSSFLAGVAFFAAGFSSSLSSSELLDSSSLLLSAFFVFLAGVLAGDSALRFLHDDADGPHTRQHYLTTYACAR